MYAWARVRACVRVRVRVFVCAGCTYVPACLQSSLRACIGAQHCQLPRVAF